MPRGKKARGPVRQVILRIPEMQYADLIVYNPSLVDPYTGATKYGGLQNYFLSLLHDDIERRRKAVREGNSNEAT